MDALFLGVLAWAITLGIYPGLLHRLSPSRLRTTGLSGVGGWPALLVMLAAPVLLMMWWGSVNEPGWGIVVFSGLTGLPASAVSLRAWQWQHALCLPAASAVALGLTMPMSPARSVTNPTPAPAAPRRLGQAEKKDRALRKARTLLLAAAVILYPVARLLQVANLLDRPEGSDTQAAVMGACLGCVAVAGVLTAVLRVRHRLRARGSSTTELAARHGWDTRAADGGLLATRFPQVPLLRSPGRSRRDPTRQVVWGVAGSRNWWALDQKGTVMDSSGARRSMRRSTIIVALPQAGLPRVVVAGMDLLKVREWLGDSLRLESDLWNRRNRVWCPPGTQRQAHALLHPRAMEHVLATLPDGMALVIDGDALAIWRDGPLTGPDLTAALHCALGMADLIPRFVLNEHSRV